MTTHHNEAAYETDHPTLNGALLVPETYSFVNSITLGWSVFRRAYWPLVATIALNLVLYIPVLTLYFVLIFTATPDNILQRMGLSYTIIIAFSVLMSVVYAGSVAIALRTIGGERPSFLMIRHAFRRAHKIIGLSIVLTVGLVAVSAVVMFVVGFVMFGFGTGPYAALGGLVAFALMMCFYVVLLLVIVRVAFAMYFFVDPVASKRGVFGAFATNWRMTSGRVWSVLGLFIVMMMGVTMTAYALLLPMVFFGGPVIIAVFASAYHLLARDHERATQDAVTAGVVTHGVPAV